MLSHFTAGGSPRRFSEVRQRKEAAAALPTGNYHCERRKVRQVTLEKYPPGAGHFRCLRLVRREAFLLAKTHTSSVSAPRADWQFAQ